MLSCKNLVNGLSAAAVLASIILAIPQSSLAQGGVAVLNQLQQKLNALSAAGGGTLQLPAGKINLSGCSDWTSNYQSTDGDDPFTVGLLIPSHIRIVGSGIGKTVFRYTRLPGDPVCSLFANVDRVGGNSDIEFSDFSIFIDDQTGAAGTANSSYSAPIYLNRVAGAALERMKITGNTDRQVNLMDVSGASIRSCLFYVNSTGYGYGDSSIGANRSGTTSVIDAHIRIENNYFAEIGRYPTFSIILVTANDVSIVNNVFDLQTFRPGLVGGNAVEAGPNTGLDAPARLEIRQNQIAGGEVWPIWATNSRIVGNQILNGGIGVTAADATTLTSLANVFIARNVVQFGSIQAKAVTAGTLTNLLIADNQIGDGWIQVQGNLDGAAVLRNRVSNSPGDGIDCYGCSDIVGNRVENVGQSAPWSDASIAINVGPIFGIPFTVARADHNVVVDGQANYSTGQICTTVRPATSVSATARSVPSACSTGTGKFVLLTGGNWGISWTNRTLYVNSTQLLIRRFLSPTELELESPALVPAGSSYQLYSTTAFAFQLYTNINSLSFNAGSSIQGWRGAAIVQQNANGIITVNSWEGNQFSPYSCWSCTYFY